MRIAALALFGLALTSCATAVYDSLDRRGVDASALLRERISSVRDDAAAAKTSFGAARDALARIKGLDGAALASQLDRAKAAGQDASTTSQQFRLSLDSARAAGDRYLAAKSEELKLLDGASQAAARAETDAAVKLQGNFFNAATGAGLRTSPALTLYNNEVALLRAHPTSGAFAATRAAGIDAAISAADDAAASLGAVGAAASSAIAATK